MIYLLADLLWSFSLISLLLHLLKLVTTAISMAIRSSSSPSSSPCPPKRVRFRSTVFSPKGIVVATGNHLQESSSQEASEGHLQENSCCATQQAVLPLAAKEQHPQEINSRSQGYPEENSCFGTQHLFENDLVLATREEPEVSRKEGLSSFARSLAVETKMPGKVRRRPARIVIPETDHRVLGFDEVSSDLGEKEYQVQGRDFCLASKKGKKKVMEDGYSVITDISGDSRQAFFGVFDGHGGRAAVDHVTEKLGNNILTAIEKIDKVEQAIREGYLTTDKEFLTQGKSSGACAATVLFKDAELHVANVGDCRVVLSRKGTAIALSNDHHVGREDERFRIESSGGYVHCHRGVWRVQGSLAVSRAIGDLHLKEWVLSEPETNTIQLTSDCEFLIVASDGLWDKVTNQEAVDVVLRQKNAIESCKMLVEISSCRGNKDDITVMVVDLKNFRQICG